MTAVRIDETRTNSVKPHEQAGCRFSVVTMFRGQKSYLLTGLPKTRSFLQLKPIIVTWKRFAAIKKVIVCSVMFFHRMILFLNSVSGRRQEVLKYWRFWVNQTQVMKNPIFSHLTCTIFSLSRKSSEIIPEVEHKKKLSKINDFSKQFKSYVLT